MNASGRCADRTTWQDMLEERVSAEDQPALLAHLDECPVCAATVAELASQWSLATLAREGRPEGPTTRAIRNRLAVRHPAAAAPQIPGIENLVLAGQGGMGAVFRGRDTRLGRTVAVKVLAGSALLSTSARARAEREARALAALDHPHIVRIHAAGEADGLPFIVMEWIEGRSLQARIDAGVVPAREAATISLALAEALGEVHAVGIIHRDLKPANVLLAAAADSSATEVPKLVDFGLARPDDGGLTHTTAVLGTPSYMAPEQTGLEPGLGGFAAATDIHGLGAVLYCMVTGKPPYEAATAGESLRRAARAEAIPLAVAAPRVPQDLRTIIETCLRFEPARRYPTAAAVADDLARFLDHQPIAARPAGPIVRLRSWARRHPTAAVAAVAAVLLAIIATGGGALHVMRLEKAHAAAMASRDAAEAAQGLAKQSLQRLTDKSIEALLLRGPALGTQDRDFLGSVRDELMRWPLEPDPAGALAFRARGLQRVANLFRRLQQLPDSLACQEMVLQTLDEMARRGLGGADLTEHRIAAQTGRRQLLHDLGRVEEFLVASRAIVTDLENLPDDSPAAKARLAEALIALAIAEDAQGNREVGLPLVARGLTLFAAASRAAPENQPLLEEEVRALYNASLLSLHAGRLDERNERLQELVSRCEEGLQRFPDRSQTLTHQFLLGLTGLASFELTAGRPEAADAIVARRERVAQQAAERHPDNAVFHGECIDAGLQRSVCQEALGQLGEARAAIEAAVRLAEAALEREPAVLDRALLLAAALARQAEVYDLLGEQGLAAAARDRRRTVLMPWKERPPVASLIAEDSVSDQGRGP
jgi:tetratricopeptide (TPR) repeat protein